MQDPSPPCLMWLPLLHRMASVEHGEKTRAVFVTFWNLPSVCFPSFSPNRMRRLWARFIYWISVQMSTVSQLPVMPRLFLAGPSFRIPHKSARDEGIFVLCKHLIQLSCSDLVNFSFILIEITSQTTRPFDWKISTMSAKLFQLKTTCVPRSTRKTFGLDKCRVSGT